MNRAFRTVIRLLLLAVLNLPVWAASTLPTDEVSRLGMYLKITRDLNRTEVRAAFEVWNEELMRKFHVPTEVRYYSDMPTLRRDFDAGKVNLVIADAMSFVRYFKPDELANGFTTQLRTDASLLLLGHPEVSGKLDLAGKRIARVADDDISTTYLETLCLREHGKECAALPVDFVMVPNSHQAVTRLLFKQVDMALVNRHGYETAIELNPQLRRAGVPVETLAFDTQFFGFYSARVSPEFRKFSLRAIPTMHLEPRGRQMLDVFKTDQVALAEATALQPFYKLERDYQELKAKLAHRGNRK